MSGSEKHQGAFALAENGGQPASVQIFCTAAIGKMDSKQTFAAFSTKVRSGPGAAGSISKADGHYGRRFQWIDATHALKRSTGVSYGPAQRFRAHAGADFQYLRARLPCRSMTIRRLELNNLAHKT
jgi:hypothetical protein